MKDKLILSFYIDIRDIDASDTLKYLNEVIMEEEAINNFNKAMEKLQVLNNQFVEIVKENKKEDGKEEK